MRSGSNDEISAHFVGSIVYIQKGLYQVSSQSPLLVIDGQQRLTTVMLILEALARQLGDSEPLDGFSARKLRDYYMLNPLEEGERGFKLLLTQTDKASFLALVKQKPQPDRNSLRITENFAFFEQRVKNLGEEIHALCRGLAKLVIVDIALSRDQDNPQLIFESMNSTGRELSQADLIRNYILMGLAPTEQTKLYDEHWRPMEVGFGQEAYGSHFDGFMRHYLTLKTGEIPNIRAVYEAFKRFSRTPNVADAGVNAMVADIHTFAGYYCNMALDKEPNRILAEVFQDLRELKVDVAFPFLLELYDDFAMDKLELADFEAITRFVEAYVFRRAVCAIPTNSLNKTFATFSRSLHKNRYLESARAHLLMLPSYRRFPGDDEFKRDLTGRDLYNFSRRSYWLRRLENHDRNERVPVAQYTIEHILPQNENLSLEWQDDLGPGWQGVQQTWLHTLGNLTLTGYNSEYSDHSFARKRDMEGGFHGSPLKLNEGLQTQKFWNEEAIKTRAKRLASIAAVVWAMPSLPDDVLASYRPQKKMVVGYTLDDHQHLTEGSAIRDLFNALRKEVLALDPCVTEEFLKFYIAYKAETNFVDIVPQKIRLRLSLNMPFHELNDPRRLSRDVTNLGIWGNGDIRVDISNLADLPYVIGLVRQAFEKQMGNGEAET